ncbi:MAG: Trk system potassium transporter TrkA [Deltaproteobacteria bacterium]|nr:Trk system potassium transporter TrkA [Deltaproteobacteria bacterium]
MNIIVAGAGEVGSSVARHLAREGHDVTVIDRNPDRIAKIGESADVLTYTGSSASLRVLREAGVAKADLLIAVSNNNEVNLLTAIIAKQLGVKTAVARTSDPDQVDAEVGFSTDVLGVDLVVCPEVLTAAELTQVVRSRGAVAIERFAQNRVELIQLAVQPGTAPTQHKLRDLKLPRGALVVALLRNDELIVPYGDDVLHTDDDAFVIGRTDVIGQIEALFGKRRARAGRRVILFGGDLLARAVVRSLRDEKARVTVIDRKAAACQALAVEPDLNVVHGDATDGGLLKEEGIEHADIFAALTREDDLNLLSTLLAKQLGARRTLALVQKTEYAAIYRRLGVDATICPWLLVANQILRYVRPSELISISLLEGGKGEVLEFRARARSRIVGKPLKQLDFPRGAIIGAVMRHDEAFVPGGADAIEVDDLVVVFALPRVREQVARLFGERHWLIG